MNDRDKNRKPDHCFKLCGRGYVPLGYNCVLPNSSGDRPGGKSGKKGNVTMVEEEEDEQDNGSRPSWMKDNQRDQAMEGKPWITNVDE